MKRAFHVTICLESFLFYESLWHKCPLGKHIFFSLDWWFWATSSTSVIYYLKCTAATRFDHLFFLIAAASVVPLFLRNCHTSIKKKKKSKPESNYQRLEFIWQVNFWQSCSVLSFPYLSSKTHFLFFCSLSVCVSLRHATTKTARKKSRHFGGIITV